MLELLALVGLLIIGLVVFAALAVVFGLLKLGFKLLLIPLSLAWGLFKIALVCLLIVVGIALAPALLAVFLIAIPVLAIAGLFGLGWAVAA